ncbi:MAG: hypothetical protein DRJ50_07580 [Actinobacteria bacterium]|nr:MAG: hypothetical protein DRJ50_07580 [Actinomycetota bacterium]
MSAFGDSVMIMSDPLRPLRVNAVELLRQPGAIQDLVYAVEPEPLGVVHDRLCGDIRVDLKLEVLNDGIRVTGTVRAPLATGCRRCLADVSGTAVASITEVYQREPTDTDAFLLDSNQLDLAPTVREAILLELDVERVCRNDCAGLCPVCGIDRNDSVCSCDSTVTDDRWSALDGLILDD